VNIVEHPEAAALMGQKARERALQCFSVDRMVEEHLSLYLQISG
jgi:hypothetical protein